MHVTTTNPQIAFINPKTPPSIWVPLGITEHFNKTFCTNLALPTLASLVPESFSVEVWDENRLPIDFDQSPDIVAITGYSMQADRMIELGDRFRDGGSLVCMGGIHATCATDELRDHADVIFLGEAEASFPRFLNDYLCGSFQEIYVQDTYSDLSEAPSPEVGFMNSDAYLVGQVQTTRGCPHDCEFCSVVGFLGHKVRCKEPEKTIEECENLYRSGFRNIFITDDNFCVIKRHARDTLQALALWNRNNEEDTNFIIQATVDVARDEPLLDLLVEAGIKTLFVGVESNDPASLEEMGKKPNINRDLVSDLHTMYSHGLWVYPGLVIGFDHDRTESFERMFDFIESSVSVMPMVLPLMAAPGTKLEGRLKSEGRWRGRAVTHALSDRLSTNIIPSGMSYDELLDGYLELMKRAYDPEAYIDRLLALESFLPDGAEGRATSTPPSITLKLLSDTFASIAQYGPGYRKAAKECFRIAKRKPSHAHNIFLSLMFWQHILVLLGQWSRR